MHACVYARMYVHMYVYACMYVRGSDSGCSNVCVYMYVCMLMYVYMYVCSLVVVDTAGGEQSCSYCTIAPSSVEYLSMRRSFLPSAVLALPKAPTCFQLPLCRKSKRTTVTR